MKKLKGFYQNNRIYCILMLVSIFCIILIGVAFLVYFIDQTKNSEYGKRLYGIESVEITKDKQNEIVNKIKENDEDPDDGLEDDFDDDDFDPDTEFEEE